MILLLFLLLWLLSCEFVVGAQRTTRRRRSTNQASVSQWQITSTSSSVTYAAAVLRAIGRAAAADVGRGNGLDGSGGQHDGEDNLTEDRHGE